MEHKHSIRRIYLKELMKEKKLSLRKLEKITGISKSVIGEIANHTHKPTGSELERLREAFNLPSIDNLYQYEKRRNV